MIRYALVCDRKHAFEIWFSGSDDYERQRRRKLVACPACGSAKVEKAIMAPAVARSGKGRIAGRIADRTAPQNAPQVEAQAEAQPASEPVAMISPQEQEARRRLRELRDHLVQNADNVGQKFPEEARKMHYGEIEHRSIYGEASPEEAGALREEGIPFYPLPVLPDERN